MFDTVVTESSKFLQLDSTYQKIKTENDDPNGLDDYQTKSFECTLSYIKIKDDGTVWLDTRGYDINGAYISGEIKQLDLKDGFIFNFYDFVAGEKENYWIEYKVTMKNNKIFNVSGTLHKFKAGSDEEQLIEACDRTYIDYA